MAAAAAAAPSSRCRLCQFLEKNVLVAKKLLSLLDPLSLRSLASTCRSIKEICERHHKEIVTSSIDLVNCSHARILYPIRSYLCGVYEWIPDESFLLVTPSSALYWMWYVRTSEISGARFSHHGPLIDKRLVLRMAYELREIALYAFEARDGALLLDVFSCQPAIYKIVCFIVDAANASPESDFMYLDNVLTNDIIKPLRYEQLLQQSSRERFYYRQAFSSDHTLDITLDSSTSTGGDCNEEPPTAPQTAVATAADERYRQQEQQVVLEMGAADDIQEAAAAVVMEEKTSKHAHYNEEDEDKIEWETATWWTQSLFVQQRCTIS